MKKRAAPQLELRYVTCYGEIGAGRVVPFTPRNMTTPIVVPANTPADDKIGTMIVRGVSLEDEEIYDGDILLLRRDITRKDITANTICAVYIRSTGELVAKKLVYGNRGDYVTLRSSGGGLADVYYHADDIEVRGIVFGFQRLRNEYGEFMKASGTDDIPF